MFLQVQLKEAMVQSTLGSRYFVRGTLIIWRPPGEGVRMLTEGRYLQNSEPGAEHEHCLQHLEDCYVEQKRHWSDTVLPRKQN